MIFLKLFLLSLLAACTYICVQTAETPITRKKESASSTVRSTKGKNAGNTGKYRNSSTIRSSKMSRSHVNDEYDEDEYEEDSYDEHYDEQYVKNRRSGYGKGTMVSVQKIGRKKKSSRTSFLNGIASTVASKAAVMHQLSQGKAQQLRKIVKGKMSSQFEKFMLQLTWPDDSAINPIYTADMMHYLDTADDYPDEMAPTNPFRRTLRKIWARMSEQDHRTVLKSLCLIHHMALDLGPESSIRIRKHILRMRKEINIKKPNETYFQLARIINVNAAGNSYIPFLKAYASYAFKRVTVFVGGTKAIRKTLKGKKTKEDVAVKLLTSLEMMMLQGMNVKIEDKEQLTSLAKSILHLTANDLLNLWGIYSDGMKRLMAEEFLKNDVTAETLLQCMERYGTVSEELKGYFKRCKKMKLLKDLTEFDENQIDGDSLAAAIASGKTSSSPISFKSSIKRRSHETTEIEKDNETQTESNEEEEEVNDKDQGEHSVDEVKTEKETDITKIKKEYDDVSDKNETDEYDDDEYESYSEQEK